MEPGTRDALIAQGKWPDEIGQNVDYVHLKNERGALNFGLRSGSVDVSNSRIIGHSVSR